MRVNFLNPVQSALSSAAAFGTSIKYKKLAEQHEQKEDERYKERMGVEREKLELAKQKEANYQKHIDVSDYNSKTARKNANLEARKVRLEEKRLEMELEKMRQATEQTQSDGRNARNAAETRKMIQYGGYSVPIIGGEQNA